MNYKTYKNLTVKQKEEYDFRFRKAESFNLLNSVIVYSLIFLLIMLVMMCFGVMYIYFLDKGDFESIKNSLDPIINQLPFLFDVIYYVIIYSIIFDIIMFIFNKVLYLLWIRKNKIKIYYWWTKND